VPVVCGTTRAHHETSGVRLPRRSLETSGARGRTGPILDRSASSGIRRSPAPKGVVRPHLTWEGVLASTRPAPRVTSPDSPCRQSQRLPCRRPGPVLQWCRPSRDDPGASSRSPSNWCDAVGLRTGPCSSPGRPCGDQETYPWPVHFDHREQDRHRCRSWSRGLREVALPHRDAQGENTRPETPLPGSSSAGAPHRPNSHRSRRPFQFAAVVGNRSQRGRS
jgi:hypothetical protein